MRKFALIAVLALACSAEDFAPEEQDLVIGQTEQAMFLPFAYGHESNSTPCVAPFDPHCEVPRYRKVDLNIYTNSCSRALVKDQMMDAGAAMRNFYNALGWNILTWENTKGNRSSSVQVEIKCQTPPAGNNSLAGTNNVYENYGNCINAGSSNGFVCRYTPSFISVYDVRIEANTVNLTATKAKRFSNNLLRHEIGHALGLAHNGSAAGTQLMSQYSTNDTNSNFANIALIPNSAERDLIECYNPSGDSPNCD
jgi:hypothetical protein